MKRPLLILTSFLALSGCASPKAVPESVPADFGLSFTVLRARGDAKAAWYVVQPDGVLRAVEGVRQESTPIPPPVRVLSAVERERLWRIVRKSYWLSEPTPTGFTVASELEAKEMSVSVTGDDRRATLIGSLESGFSTEMEAILRDLAWLNEGM
jgi:hypothetical protein